MKDRPAGWSASVLPPVCARVVWVGGCGTWPAVRVGGGGTLLGPEGSRDLLEASFARVPSWWWGGGVGGCGVWLLNSGREHLQALFGSA
jgi:hypothetical protein